MFALTHAHTHREKPSLVIGEGQKSVDIANARSSDTNLGLMKTVQIYWLCKYEVGKSQLQTFKQLQHFDARSLENGEYVPVCLVMVLWFHNRVFFDCFRIFRASSEP